MKYVDGFVLAVPKNNAAKYKKAATLAGKVWKEHGALAYFECVGDDVKPGKSTSFPQAVKLKAGEVPWFSWIVYPSKKERTRINKAVMKDPRILGMMDSMKDIMDAKRMIYGGFKVVLEM